MKEPFFSAMSEQGPSEKPASPFIDDKRAFFAALYSLEENIWKDFNTDDNPLKSYRREQQRQGTLPRVSPPTSYNAPPKDSRASPPSRPQSPMPKAKEPKEQKMVGIRKRVAPDDAAKPPKKKGKGRPKKNLDPEVEAYDGPYQPLPRDFKFAPASRRMFKDMVFCITAIYCPATSM